MRNHVTDEIHETPLFTHAHAHVDSKVTVTDGSNKGITWSGKCDSGACAHARIETSVTVTDLPDLLGIPALRDYQIGPVTAGAEGRDVLIIFPTGGGKTVVFSSIGLIRGGLTLCVYPLRSLIADQFRRLSDRGLPVRMWTGDVKDRDKQETLEAIGDGWSGFLLTTPESLKGRDLSNGLRGRVNTCVVDEAHAVLRERGFRVSYAWLGGTLASIGHNLMVAATATLPAHDREHLIRSLKMRTPEVFTMPVARGNLDIRVVDRSLPTLTAILDKHRGEPGIVFAATVATATKIHGQLCAAGRNVGLYHGRLPAKEKTASQKAFMGGTVPVMITTDAFLLGIDKADIRFIVHYDHPKSVEDWVQGFGRAGRDGEPASVYGCFSGSREGMSSRAFLVNSSYPPVGNIESVWRFLTSMPFCDLTADQIGERVLGRAGRHSGGAIMSQLKRYRLAEVKPHPGDGRKRLYFARGNFLSAPWDQYRAEKEQTLSRFDSLCSLVRLPDDRIPGAIDSYFGDGADM